MKLVGMSGPFGANGNILEPLCGGVLPIFKLRGPIFLLRKTLAGEMEETA